MTATATKLYRLTYAVEGRGDFPIDMLRYDSSFPATERDAAMIMHGAELGDGAGRRLVRLVHYTERRPLADVLRYSAETAASAAGLTPERWRSFGWSLVVVEAAS